MAIGCAHIYIGEVETPKHIIAAEVKTSDIDAATSAADAHVTAVSSFTVESPPRARAPDLDV